MPIIQKVVKSGSDIYSDGWKSYNALAIYGYNHKKVKHSEDEFARSDGTHINGVESFWSWAKRRLAKFNGIKKGHFQLYLLECEWRFNHRENLDSNLRKLLRKI
jgi:transposase-like protein